MRFLIYIRRINYSKVIQQISIHLRSKHYEQHRQD
jgi:hypothetical protein